MSDDTLIDHRSLASGVFRFDGLLATDHKLPAGDLGHALIGLDTLAKRLLALLEYGQASPRRGRRRAASLQLTVTEPAQGSFEIPWLVQFAPTLLPLVPDLVDAVRGKLVEHFVNYVLLFFGGRKREAAQHMERMLDIIESDRRMAHEDRQREREHMQRLLATQASHLRAAAREAVTPVGRSAATFTADPVAADAPVIDAATADAIREKEEVTVSDVMDIIVEVEGLRDRKRTLWAVDPEDPAGEGTFAVHIVDPSFADEGGVYREAYVRRSRLKLTGKMTRHADGRIKGFHAIGAALED